MDIRFIQKNRKQSGGVEESDYTEFKKMYDIKYKLKGHGVLFIAKYNLFIDFKKIKDRDAQVNSVFDTMLKEIGYFINTEDSEIQQAVFLNKELYNMLYTSMMENQHKDTNSKLQFLIGINRAILEMIQLTKEILQKPKRYPRSPRDVGTAAPTRIGRDYDNRKDFRLVLINGKLHKKTENDQIDISEDYGNELCKNCPEDQVKSGKRRSSRKKNKRHSRKKSKRRHSRRRSRH